ncbi:phosphotransferase [Streptomyces sp. VRA16 Mangrove soil]|uniref:phosphotransferase n=1 Tax=Streptomyces sp. VRA16 Mangrove soil TaxID=2817434 RepID=UPI001A9F8996|nr:phosphotransferase [Streptomyces sp. VRA16 Mangrove soil]MBO1330595.1 hypothetical protein [Streptomyces sp. VRA16 Mangrove soil]
MHRRSTGYARLSTALALIDDRRLRQLVHSAASPGSGIGGRSGVLDLDGTPAFVKRVPLTARELSPHHLRSTANLFDLPAFYQYGIGSTGFGAWRELALHIMTTNWVLSGAHDGFPLTYHWRVLPDAPPDGFLDDFGGLDGAVAHWEGSPEVRMRLTELAGAEHSLVLFLEYVPETLAQWLAPRTDPADYRWALAELERTTAFLGGRGVVHFDAHLANLLTDGERVLFADFGLALSSRFRLSDEETRFLAGHLRSYDLCWALRHLRRHHLPDDAGAASAVDALLAPYAPALRVVDGFAGRLLRSRRTPYPAEAVEAALPHAATT